MESVPVRCPACGRDHAYSAPAYPCPCGTPTAPSLLPGAPALPVTHRTWNDNWVTVCCPGCGRHDQWPRPELYCPCGTVLRVPVRPAAPPDGAAPPSHIPLPRTAPAPRPAFRPAAVHDADDAVATAARYLRWLGYRDVVRASRPSPARIDLRAPGLLAQVDVSARATTLRDVECLWLHALDAAATGVLFSVPGYAPDAGAHADRLGVPLFTMDAAGTPRPVNGPADELLGTGARAFPSGPADPGRHTGHMRIRTARRSDLPLLQDIERAAGEPFRTLGMTSVADDDPPPLDLLDAYRQDGRAWVAVDPDDHPVGYLIADPVDGAAHIEQVSVHPSAARRGLGAALIAHLEGWAAGRRLDALTLTTFSHVPWNAPYYARLGFRTLGEAELTDGLRKIRAEEAEHGLDRWPRVCMRREIPHIARP